MGAAVMIGATVAGVLGIGGLTSDIFGMSKAAKETKNAQEESARLIAQTQAKEEARRKQAESDAKYAYIKEQKMTSLKESAVQAEIAASTKYAQRPSSILTEKMAEKNMENPSTLKLKQTLGSF